MHPFTHIGVIGCGQMGAGIAEVCARAGLRVTVVETTDSAALTGLTRLESSLRRAHDKGRVADVDLVLKRTRVLTDLDAVAECELVIEAVAEDQATKLELFKALDSIVTSPDAVLATNTSSIPIMTLAMATTRPANVIGIHFFNPVPVLSLVELIPSLLTADTTYEHASDFTARTLGKHPIRSQDRAGFVVNALLIPFILSAIRMLESGFATATDIDEGMVRGCAHPLGPLALADLIGLDTTKSVAESMYSEFKEPLYSPPPLLARMVDAGLLGRKSGRGFHDYAAQV